MFASVRTKKPHIKVLNMGPYDAGKTFDMFHLPGPLGGIDGEDGLYAYQEQYDFGLEEAYDMDDMLAILDKLVNTREGKERLARLGTIGLDGVSRMWQLGVDDVTNDAGNVAFANQKDLKSPWKRLNNYIKELGLRKMNVMVTAHTKIDWETRPGQAPVARGMKGDFEGRLLEAFDLVLYREKIRDDDTGSVRYQATVIKSRYPTLLPQGTVVKNWEPWKWYPRLLGQIKPETEAGETTQPSASEMIATISEICQRRRSVSKGGMIPDALASRAAFVMKQGEATPDTTAVLRELQALDALADASGLEATAS